MTKNIHSMGTRSKIKKSGSNPPSSDDVDERGNIKGLIDYSEDEEYDSIDLNNEIFNLSKGKMGKKKTSKRKSKKNQKINNMMMSYLIMKATEKANEELKKRRIGEKSKKTKSKIKVVESEQDDKVIDITLNPNKKMTILDYIYEDTTDDDSYVNEYSEEEEEEEEEEEDEEEEEEEEEYSEEEEEDDNIRYTLKDMKHSKILVEEESDSYDSSEEEYDDLDEEYEELVDETSTFNSEEHDLEYFHKLKKYDKEKTLCEIKEIYQISSSNIPLRFKVINSNMNRKTKSIAIDNLDKLSEMDVSTGEYSKMDNWINGLIKIPFGEYSKLPVNKESNENQKQKYMIKAYEKLDNAIYGHQEAKTHILQVIGKWIQNPESGGNVLAIQGPMGNGKTTLVKEGISKILERPFAFISLGGASDSAYFDGHNYTYEGSNWGRIVQILQESKCMDPIFYFDELDKISESYKGEEIIHLLTHLTDSSQNSLFQDNYFPGIDIDLSKALFIFSFNDEEKVDKILKDRMYVINTKGFKLEDKLEISKKYLLPDILKIYNISNKDIIFSDETIKYIIENYTEKEEGVRNLKRCFETMISKINLYDLSYTSEKLKNNLYFKISNYQRPFNIKNECIDELLKKKEDELNPPLNMYL